MVLYVQKNHTDTCKCGNEKQKHKSMCDDCTNYWQYNFAKDGFHWNGDNNTVDNINANLNIAFGGSASVV